MPAGSAAASGTCHALSGGAAVHTAIASAKPAAARASLPRIPEGENAFLGAADGDDAGRREVGVLDQIPAELFEHRVGAAAGAARRQSGEAPRGHGANREMRAESA